MVKTIEELKGCLQNNYPCKSLLGCLSLEPLMVSCRTGNECGRGVCCFYTQGKHTIDEIIKLECL